MAIITMLVGLGVLLAYCLFCKDKTTRQSAPGAVVIHLLGGIHERAYGRDWPCLSSPACMRW